MWKLSMLVVASLACGSAVGSQKFDAAIGSVLRSGAESGNPLMAKAARQNSIPVLIRIQGEDVSYLEEMGVQIRSRLGNIVSANVPLSSIGSLVAEERVTYIEAERQMIGRLNVSVPATRASLIRSGAAPNFTGATGSGVIVGVIDDGLDFRHLDFRKPDGSTRLLGLWDQRVNGAAGTPPAGFNYGGECTPAMLNDAIGGNGAACTQPSTGNHGTHVGGIAAGNGQQTGNGQPAYRFGGMAPYADILAANSIAGGTGGNAVVDAIAWMKARAQSLGKPVVINLSLGSYFGSRDGTSNFEQALSNAGAPGVIVVAAAGNEGKDAIRASGNISQGETQTVTFNWGATVTAAQRMEIWYPGTNQYAIKFNGPGGCTTGYHTAGTTNTYTLPCGTLEITSTVQQASNDDRQILANFTPASPVAGSQGAWSVEIRGDVVAQASTPFSLISGEDGGGLLFTSNTTAVTTQILTDTASATRTIGVAAYNTNYTWTSLGGNPFTAGGAGPIGDVSDFSSRGPRRNCSNLAKCPVIAKPEITAPGSLIMSALGQDAPVPGDGTTEADGKHVAYNGTSMATPHVSGAVALMLQKNPNLTPEQVKGILFSSIQSNAFSTGLPNIAWGNGILDAQAAVNNTPSLAKKRTDFNGDGKSDVLLRNQNGSNYIWHLDGTNLAGGNVAIPTSGGLPAVDPSWSVAGKGDFNGDGKADILWRNTNGLNFIWHLDGTQIVNGNVTVSSFGALPTFDNTWSFAGVGDFNGDGKSDVLLRNQNGTNYIWHLDGTNLAGGNVAIPTSGNLPLVDPSWSVAGIGDFNGDGKADILWRNTNGLNFIWHLDGTQIVNGGVTVSSFGALPTFDNTWSFAGVGDFNGDGKSDVLLRNQNGTNYIWHLDGTNLAGGNVAIPTSGNLPLVDPSWSVVGMGDFNGDGKADILWRNTTNNLNFIWHLDGTQIVGGNITVSSFGALPSFDNTWSFPNPK